MQTDSLPPVAFLVSTCNPRERKFVGKRKGTPKNLCGKDFAELSGELSGAICLKTLVLLGSALELFRKFFGAVRAIFWLWVLFWPLNSRSFSDRSYFEHPSGHGRPPAPSGHGRPRRNACFSRISRAWPKLLPPDVRRDIRVDVRRISGPKTYHSKTKLCKFNCQNNF